LACWTWLAAIIGWIRWTSIRNFPGIECSSPA